MADIEVQRALLCAIEHELTNFNRIINNDCDMLNDETEDKLFKIYQIIRDD